MQYAILALVAVVLLLTGWWQWIVLGALLFAAMPFMIVGAILLIRLWSESPMAVFMTLVMLGLLWIM